MRLVVDYDDVNKKIQKNSGSFPNTENALETILKCGFKSKIDKRSGLGQVCVARGAPELLTSVTPKGRVMPFNVANAPAIFQELMNKILYILKHRPLVQELVFPRDQNGGTHG